ncbi:MAG: acetyl-CoA carboxylase biotin carboxylase subunit [Thermoplasmatota archaeon]
MFKRVLIANRGEIAVRIQRGCRALGVETVAVYSDADAEALHVRMADEAVRLGPAPSTESYLDQEKVLAAAAETGAEAIHPGYGFLSENAEFARKVEAAGLVWIGPPPSAMDTMGDKVSARAAAEAAGVPVAPGSEALRDADHAAQEAERIGYPVMLKASAGGGGIGMRIVHDPALLASEFDSATKQAASAFGVPDVFMEKFIERPRHIEIQILADGHGNVLHLYERECSIQRRHQKLLEEAPSPALSQEEREAIGARGVELARQVGYVNAGTLEFLFERGADGSPMFYFNEMNTRLQVEHPVTEAVTGLDLVQWQLRIAAGEKLTVQQEDVQLKGHAIELRINAEDPEQGFLPSPGPVQRLRLPRGRGIRVDGGLYEGWTVPSAYDSMVLKLITHGRNRDVAADRAIAALDDMELEGFTTNAAFHHVLLEHPAFREGDLSTRFLEEHDIVAGDPSAVERARAAAVVAALLQAPGGGLAGLQLRQHTPPVVALRPGRRDWRSD